MEGVALGTLGCWDDARDALIRAWGATTDPDYGVYLAEAEQMCGRDAAAEELLGSVLALDPTLADAHALLVYSAEARGDWSAAEASERRAHALDPEAFPLPFRVDGERFLDWLRAAVERLPEAFRRRVREVDVRVEPVPSRELLARLAPDLDRDTLGFFDGYPIGELAEFGGPPPRIYVFQRNVERGCHDEAELRRQAAITLYHELGHYLGLDEDEVDAIGLG